MRKTPPVLAAGLTACLAVAVFASASPVAAEEGPPLGIVEPSEFTGLYNSSASGWYGTVEGKPFLIKESSALGSGAGDWSVTTYIDPSGETVSTATGAAKAKWSKEVCRAIVSGFRTCYQFKAGKWNKVVEKTVGQWAGQPVDSTVSFLISENWNTQQETLSSQAAKMGNDPIYRYGNDGKRKVFVGSVKAPNQNWAATTTLEGPVYRSSIVAKTDTWSGKQTFNAAATKKQVIEFPDAAGAPPLTGNALKARAALESDIRDISSSMSIYLSETGKYPSAKQFNSITVEGVQGKSVPLNSILVKGNVYFVAYYTTDSLPAKNMTEAASYVICGYTPRVAGSFLYDGASSLFAKAYSNSLKCAKAINDLGGSGISWNPADSNVRITQKGSVSGKP